MAYQRLARLDDALRCVTELSARTIIFDVEPLVANWDTSQQVLDQGVAFALGQVAADPRVAAVCFATNSARRPSALPSSKDLQVVYLASARKPFRTAPYRGLPRPGVVIGDQLATDGILARRLGYTFLHYRPQQDRIPIGPRLMSHLGRGLRPFLFRCCRVGFGDAIGKMDDHGRGF